VLAPGATSAGFGTAFPRSIPSDIADHESITSPATKKSSSQVKFDTSSPEQHAAKSNISSSSSNSSHGATCTCKIAYLEHKDLNTRQWDNRHKQTISRGPAEEKKTCICLSG